MSWKSEILRVKHIVWKWKVLQSISKQGYMQFKVFWALRLDPLSLTSPEISQKYSIQQSKSSRVLMSISNDLIKFAIYARLDFDKLKS